MADSINPTAAMPLVRALERFAGGLAAVGRGMDKSGHGGASAMAGGMAASAISQDWGGVFKRLSVGLDSVSKKYMEKATAMAGGGSKGGAMTVASISAAKTLGGFAKVASVATGTLTKFNVVTGVASTVIAAGKKVPVVGQLANAGQAGYAMIGKRLTSDLVALQGPVQKFNRKVETLTASLQVAGDSANAYSSAVNNSTSAIASAAQNFMKGLGGALSDPIGGLPALVGAVRPFVAAFNPYALNQFDDALQTVYAVIGEALVPVVKMAASVLREFAGYLRPAMKMLAPIIEQLATMAGSFLKDIIPEIVMFVQELVPVFRQFLAQMKESIDGQKESIKAGLLYATGQIGMLEYMRRGLSNWLSKLPLIGRFFGPSKEEKEKGVQKDLVPKENLFKFGAPTNPTFKGAEALGRDTLQAAYAAMPDMEKKNEELDAMKQIAANTEKANGLLASLLTVQGGADTYDKRLADAKKPNAGVVDKTVGGAQWGAGQLVEGIYNFGFVGPSNLLKGKSFTDSMVDI